MVKIAVLALLLAGAIGWAVRDEAGIKPAGPPSSREQFAQKVKENTAMRTRLQKQHPEAWRGLVQQTRRDLATCVVTEILPGVLKADCL